MELHLDCVPCFQKQALNATRYITKDLVIQERVLRRVMENLYWTEWARTPPEMAHMVHRIVKEECNCKDPYKDVKKEYNDIALEMVPQIKNTINGSADRLRTAMLLAIAGNVIDFGALSDFNLEKELKEVLRKGLAIDHSEKLKKKLESAKTILYLGDNTGEIVFDKMFLQEIMKTYGPKRIVFGVKGGPILNDSTLEDAQYVGLDKLPNIEFINIHIGEPGTGIKRGSDEFLDLLDEYDIAISKGQGNYEALSQVEGIFFLLMAKCPVIAMDLDVKIGSFIAKEV